MAVASYSPRLRTAVVLCGAGTAGAYQAGVLRAFAEAGIKIDLAAGHGVGVVSALASAVDGGAKLWNPGGPWSSPRLRQAYRWRPALRLAGVGLLTALACLLAPLIVLVIAALIYALSILAALVNLPGVAASLVDAYQASLALLFHPPILPTVVPRAVVLALLVVLGVLLVSFARTLRHDRSRRRLRGAAWWRLVGAPLTSDEPAAILIETIWELVRGASSEGRPAAAMMGRRYVEVLTENFGQPGFREVLVAVHDLDARRDIVGAILPDAARVAFGLKRGSAGPREAETIDLAGAERDLLIDLVNGATRLPVASAPHVVQFPTESYWRGEAHRLCDRPELVQRLIDEIAALGVEQVVLVSAAPPPAVPHGMRSRPVDVRGRTGELLRSIETAAAQDAARSADARFSGVFVIRPDHNPVGPFDFGGTYDESSDRRRSVAELMEQGYSDAYRQFIEPVVAAGERVEAV